jgi:hypothetical protein
LNHPSEGFSFPPPRLSPPPPKKKCIPKSLYKDKNEISREKQSLGGKEFFNAFDLKLEDDVSLENVDMDMDWIISCKRFNP